MIAETAASHDKVLELHLSTLWFWQFCHKRNWRRTKRAKDPAAEAALFELDFSSKAGS